MIRARDLMRAKAERNPLDVRSIFASASPVKPFPICQDVVTGEQLVTLLMDDYDISEEEANLWVQDKNANDLSFTPSNDVSSLCGSLDMCCHCIRHALDTSAFLPFVAMWQDKQENGSLIQNCIGSLKDTYILLPSGSKVDVVILIKMLKMHCQECSSAEISTSVATDTSLSEDDILLLCEALNVASCDVDYTDIDLITTEKIQAPPSIYGSLPEHLPSHVAIKVCFSQGAFGIEVYHDTELSCINLEDAKPLLSSKEITKVCYDPVAITYLAHKKHITLSNMVYLMGSEMGMGAISPYDYVSLYFSRGIADEETRKRKVTYLEIISKQKYLPTKEALFITSSHGEPILKDYDTIIQGYKNICIKFRSSDDVLDLLIELQRRNLFGSRMCLNRIGELDICLSIMETHYRDYIDYILLALSSISTDTYELDI